MITEKCIGKYCVVRCDKAGVFAGNVTAVEGTTAEMENVRRLWSWSGASETLQIAAEGVKQPQGCQFTMPVDHLVVLGVNQIQTCTPKAEASIKGVKIWKI